MGLTFRRLLEARFGELTEAEWQELVKRGYADAYDLAADELERQEAFDSAVAYLKRKGIRPRPQSRESSTITLFSAHALSRAFTAIQWANLQRILNAPDEELTLQERALRDTIRSFRVKFLPDGAIPEDSIAEWLRQHQQHAPTYWAKVALPEEVYLQGMEAIRQNRPVEYTLSRETLLEVGATVPLIEYEGRIYRAAPELFQAVQALERETGWTETQCLRFLLSNSVPEGLPIQASVVWGLTEGATFIELRLPAFLEAEAVAQLYRYFQKQAYANRRRLQGIQERTAELIRFVETYRVCHPKARWREVAEAWNTHCVQVGRPQWQVSESTLKRHYERYIRTVLDLVQGSPVGSTPTGDGSG